jgi:alkylhydroperoxidase/carboxymuconolactone decarboxylase family protein YurZ
VEPEKEVAMVARDPLSILEKHDPQLIRRVRETAEFAMADGALPKRFKLIIAMVLDAAHGAVGGVEALAREAKQAGATQEEIMEALRVAQYVSGVGSVYVASHALRDVL